MQLVLVTDEKHLKVYNLKIDATSSVPRFKQEDEAYDELEKRHKGFFRVARTPKGEWTSLLIRDY